MEPRAQQIIKLSLCSLQTWMTALGRCHACSHAAFSATSTSESKLLPSPCELEHLKFSLDQQHPGGSAIISAIQFYKAWTAFIALEAMFQMTNDPLGA
jgi:hypothetical protein